MTRPTCPHCRTPLPRCFCDLVTLTTTAPEIIIWQHPDETRHAKGTVPLLRRCLTNSRIIVAESLTREQFAEATSAPVHHLFLLFPATDNTTVDADPATAPVQRLLVLDGTWRKARKLLYLNPWLQQLPRFELVAPPPGRYHIRKAENPDQLSTLEAVCAAITQLENSPASTAPILQAFDRYMARLGAQRQNRSATT